MQLLPEAIQHYAHTHTSPEDPLLMELAQETRANARMPDMQGGHVVGSLLRMLVQLSSARQVLEIGTFTGYSALCMAQGLPPEGRLITCDIDPIETEPARKFWARSPHGAKIELRLAPALETLQALDGPFDLVFIDADKENYVNYWEACLPKLRPGGLLITDNTLWDGRVLEPQAPSDFAIAAFNEHVRKDTRVEAVLLTVRDGLTLARKKEEA